MTMRSPGKLALARSPAGLFLILAASIFVAEMLVMLLVAVLPKMPPLLASFLDATILVVAVFPALLLFAFTPLRGQLRALEEAEAQLREASRTLEQRVRERTAALAESEERLRVLVDSVQIGVVVHDPQTRIQLCNAAACRLLGFSDKELLGKSAGDSILQFVNEDGSLMPVPEYPVNRVLATRQSLRDCLAGIRPATEPNATRWVVVNAEPIFNTQGQVTQVIVAFLDITARRQAEKALQREEEFARTLLDNIADGVVACDAQGTLVLFNRTAREWHGMDALALPPEEWGRHYDLYGPDGMTPLLTESIPLVRAFRGETVGDAGMAIVAKGQPPRDVLAAGCPFFDARHNLLGAVVVMRDITERKRAEAALRASEEKFATLFEKLAFAASISSLPDGAFVSVNAAFERMTGFSKEEAIGKTTLELGISPDAETRARIFTALKEHGSIHDQEFAIRTKSGALRVLSLNSDMVNIGGQKHLLTTTLDVTDRKQAAAELARHREQLEQLVGERTRDLEGARAAALSLMQDSQRQQQRLEGALAAQRVMAGQLEAANKELESFSYSVSHDLRSPLRHIQGYAAMLTESLTGQLSDEARRYLKTITKASIEMGQLIDDLLAFSRMSRSELNESRVHLDGLVQDTIRGLEMTTQGRNIAWKIAPLPPVLGDASMLKQVLANLIGNAAKYSRQRDPAEIEIGCCASAGEDDRRVILFVKDNGAGFDMDYAHKLFGVFQRLHRADEFEGTGIGLAIVQRIIARHGGRTWAEGALDQGATFYFTLKPATAV